MPANTLIVTEALILTTIVSFVQSYLGNFVLIYVPNSASVTISVFAGMIPPMLLLFLGFSLFETLVIPVLVLDGLALAVAIFSFIMLKKAKLCDR